MTALSCLDTVKEFSRMYAPCWNSKDMRRNRLALSSDNAEQLLNANVSWIHVEWTEQQQAHDCILLRFDDSYRIVDSWINYRGITVIPYSRNDILKLLSGDPTVLNPPAGLGLGSRFGHGWFSVWDA